MKTQVSVALLASTFFVLTETATASPIQWSEVSGGNGHYYELVKSLSSWSQATSDAESRIFLGVNGYLASITSAAENKFLTDTFAPLASDGPQIQVWIGGYQPPGSPEPAGNWTWTSNEQWTYSNWSPGQPNNDAGAEHWLVLYVKPNIHGAIGEWGDAPDNAGTLAYYIVEYATPVPCGGLDATIVGTDGPDLLRGSAGNDVIAGLGGDDVLYGLGGDDILCGGDGNDVLLGGSGKDRLFGGAGRDALFGEAGNDQLFGQGGNDYLNGGGGDDVLNGGSGIDVCDGGPHSAGDTAHPSCEPALVLNVP